MIKKLKNQIITILILILFIVILSLLKNNSYISEYVFARKISRFYIETIGSITKFLPFSLYEILIVIATIVLVIELIKIIKNLIKKNYYVTLKKIFNVATIILSIVFIYNLTASMSYNRNLLDLNLNEEKPQEEIVLQATQYFLNDYNQIAQNLERDEKGNIILPYTVKQLSEKIKEEYAKLNSDFFGKPQTAKPMIFSEIMSYMGFSGVFMSITAEPNINKNIPPQSLPMVTAHEMAHSAGIMRENEANLLAYYVLLNSDDEYLRYSGYSASFSQMLTAVLFTCGQDEYNSLKENISQLIIKENQNAAIYWSEHKSIINGISEFINDLYLKISGIEEGTASYQNPYDVTDTGQTDEQGEIVYEINYSKIQKMYFTIYNIITL